MTKRTSERHVYQVRLVTQRGSNFEAQPLDAYVLNAEHLSDLKALDLQKYHDVVVKRLLIRLYIPHPKSLIGRIS